MIIDNNDVNTVVQPENTVPIESVPVDTNNGEIIEPTGEIVQDTTTSESSLDREIFCDNIIDEVNDIVVGSDFNAEGVISEELLELIKNIDVNSVKEGEENTETETPVYTTGASLIINGQENYYDTYSKAISTANALPSLGVPVTIKLWQDVETTGTTIIGNQNVDIILDLNGHSINYVGGKTAVTLALKGNIEIKNGTVSNLDTNQGMALYAGYKSRNTAGEIITYTGNVTISDGAQIISDNNLAISIVAGSGVTVNGDTTKIVSTNYYGILLSSDTFFVMNGGTLLASIVNISGNGTTDGTNITINGGRIENTGTKLDDLVMYHPQEGNLTITGGEFIGPNGIQYCGSGEIKISGGTFRATREYTEFPDKSSQEADGNTDDGSALSLISRGSGYQDKDAEGKVKTMKLEITGGEFISDNNNAISIYRLKQHPDTKIWYVDNDTNDISNTNDTDFLDNYTEYVNISGGTFKSGSVDKKETLHVDPKAKEMGTVTITGGKFTTDPSQANNPANPDEPFNYVADGYIVEDTEDGMKLVTLPKPPEPEPPSNGGDDGTGDDNTDGDNGTGDDNTDGDDDKPNGDNNNNHRPSGGGSSSSDDDDDEKTPSTVVDKTELEDGSKVTVESGKDSVTTTVERPDGSSSVTTVDSDGNIKSDVMIVNEAIDRNKNADAPISHITASDDTDSAHSITITVEDNNFAKVEIPVENMTAGTVAVKVHPDGREEVIKMTAMGENGVIVPVDGIATVKIVDRSKYFIDVPDTYWGTHAVDYIASRDLFAGTSDITFTPDSAMTRAMVWTVLARFDGHDTTGGETWYEKGREWAMANGVSDGTNHDVEITREQLVSMLHRYYMYKGHANDTINYSIEGYADYGNISEYAVNSMEWAVNTGLITGTSDVTLSPVDNATRGQVAMIMMNFCEKLARQQ